MEIADHFSKLLPLVQVCRHGPTYIQASCKALLLSCSPTRSQYLTVGRLRITTEAAAAGGVSATQQAFDACSKGLASTQPCMNYTHTHTLPQMTTVGGFHRECNQCPRIGIVPIGFIITWLRLEIPRTNFR